MDEKVATAGWRIGYVHSAGSRLHYKHSTHVLYYGHPNAKSNPNTDKAVVTLLNHITLKQQKPTYIRQADNTVIRFS